MSPAAEVPEPGVAMLATPGLQDCDPHYHNRRTPRRITTADCSATQGGNVMSGFESRTDAWGPATRWSLVRRASGSSLNGETHDAWHSLVERYRAPVRMCVVRALRGHPDAEVAVDDFFTYLFERSILPRVSGDEGRFRCYMQGVIHRFAKHWKRGEATKGSGDDLQVEIPVVGGHEVLDQEEESLWASSILGRAIERLRTTYPEEAEILFRCYGIPPYELSDRDDLAREKGKKTNAINQAVHRGRARLRTFVLEELQELVDSPEDFEAEQEVMLARMLASQPSLFAEKNSALDAGEP